MKPATLEQLKACQFSSWYPQFRRLNKTINNHNETIAHDNHHQDYKHNSHKDNSVVVQEPRPRLRNNVTIRSIIISPLPEEFIHYLKSDGIILPRGAEKVSSFLPTEVEDQEDDQDDEFHDHCCHHEDEESLSRRQTDEVEGEEDSDNDAAVLRHGFYFPQLNQQIQSALDTLGPCLPKLNWSAPRDVSWLNESTLKCSTVGDVYLLLKSSDFCMFDLEHALDDIELQQQKNSSPIEKVIEYELVLRKWSNLHASMEFRCFVTHHCLLGICQRNHAEYYPHLPKECGKIKGLILDFFKVYIQHNFANGRISDYVFDVYVDKNDCVWLIDFNLWSTRTDALMFTWEELLEMATTRMDEGGNVHDEETEMRVVMNEYDIRFDPLASYRAPIDTVALARKDPGEDGLQSFEDFMAMCARPSDLVSEKEEDDEEEEFGKDSSKM